MKKLQMVDLKGQYTHIKSEVDQAIMDVVNSTAYINGSCCSRFSKELRSLFRC